MKVADTNDRTHNPFGETCWASCLRENLTSSSYGKGLETNCNQQISRQSFTRQQLFRTLKKQGLDLESSQVEEDESLMKRASIAVVTAVHTLQLTMAREGQPERPATDVFEVEELNLLEELCPRLEGATEKQKNPYAFGQLAWAAWLIARLGGWKGYASEAKPGPITMFRGQQYFASLFQGWKIAKMCA